MERKPSGALEAKAARLLVDRLRAHVAARGGALPPGWTAAVALCGGRHEACYRSPSGECFPSRAAVSAALGLGGGGGGGGCDGCDGCDGDMAYLP